MTFPGHANIADACGVPAVGCRDPKRAGCMLGNAMALQNVALVLMVALSCFRPAA